MAGIRLHKRVYHFYDYYGEGDQPEVIQSLYRLTISVPIDREGVQD